MARRHNRGTSCDCHRQLLLEGLTEFYSIIERSGYQLSAADAARLEVVVWSALRHYKWLARNA
eukprot:1138763-Lingulodinium_polyedra.AAC.1